jgi:hypothetical protein
MNDRARASDLLRKARAILAERLTERINEQSEELLDDARGDSYMNEIESLYDELGTKLSHVSQMLSNLPAEEPSNQPPGQQQPQTQTAAAQHSPENTFTVATEPAPNYDGVTQYTLPAIAGPTIVAMPALPALPAPKFVEPTKHRATNSALQAFAAQIQAGDLLAAGRTLAGLFDLEEPRAIACAATFAQRVRSEAAFFRKVMELAAGIASAARLLRPFAGGIGGNCPQPATQAATDGLD